MIFNRSVRKVRSARRALGLIALGLVLGSLTGCQSITGSPTVSQVRVIDASPDAGGLDIYQGSGVLAYNLGLGTITSYIPTIPGTYAINVDAAGTRQQLAQQAGTFQINSQYTVLVGNYMAGLQETILKDQSVPAPTGQIAVRVLDQSARAGAVDLYFIPSGSTIAQVKPLLSNVVFGQNTGYLNIPVGTYTLAALPAGTVASGSTTASYTGAAVTYFTGSARTFVLLDQPTLAAPALQVIVASDYDSATQV